MSSSTATTVPIIVDLGLLVDDDSASTLQNVGTPEFMAPELLNGHVGDIRSDIFSLGVVMFRMLAGYDVWQAGSFIETMRRNLREPVPVDAMAASPALKQIVRDATAINIDGRPAEPSLLVEALLATPESNSYSEPSVERSLAEIAAEVAGESDDDADG